MILKSTEQQTAEQAYQYALRLLTGRDYSIARMRDKLTARAICPLDVLATIERLQGEGWLDDRRYAERFAESAITAGRFYGPRLRQEMRRRGFAADLVTEVMDRLLTGRDTVAEVTAVLERRYPAFSFASASDREKQRVIGFLQRRGFGFGEIMQALRVDRNTF